MPVVRPVAYRNADALCRNSSDRNKNARPKKGDEQKFLFDHTPLIRARASRNMGLFRKVRNKTAPEAFSELTTERSIRASA